MEEVVEMLKVLWESPPVPTISHCLSRGPALAYEQGFILFPGTEGAGLPVRRDRRPGRGSSP